MEYLRSRTQEEMLGIAKDDLRLDVVLQLFALHAFDGADGSHGHKYRREYIAVVGVYHTCPRTNRLRLAM